MRHCRCRRFVMAACLTSLLRRPIPSSRARLPLPKEGAFLMFHVKHVGYQNLCTADYIPKVTIRKCCPRTFAQRFICLKPQTENGVPEPYDSGISHHVIQSEDDTTEPYPTMIFFCFPSMKLWRLSTTMTALRCMASSVSKPT